MASQVTRVMTMKNDIKKMLFIFVLLMLPAAVALAVIPEPDNIIFGDITLDGVAITATNTDVSIVVEYADKELASYTMGSKELANNKYLLEISLDSILQRNESSVRDGDLLVLYYKTANSRVKAAEVVVNERGTRMEVNLNLQSEDLVIAADNSAIDSDEDGISDVYEVANGLNPLDANDAILDSDGDGVTNLVEYQNGTDINLDDNLPHLIAPLNLTANASGLFTEVDLGVATAFDFKDGILTATANNYGPFAPGEHVVVWSVSDEAGNTVTADQIIKVIPQVSFHQDQLVAEGNTVTLTAELNGLALAYPVKVPFTVSGTATTLDGDHNLNNDEIVITGGFTGSVSFPIFDEGVAAEGMESVVITMGVPVNAVPGNRSIFTANITEDNIAPRVMLSASQDGTETSVLSTTGSLVTVTAVVNDNNSADVHSYDWALTDTGLVDTDGDLTNSSFVFDAATLAEGSYKIAVSVSDSVDSSYINLVLTVVNNLPLLTSLDTDGDGLYDDQEGLTDANHNGIPDYLDANKQSNILHVDASLTDHYLLETEFGLSLSLGYAAISAAEIDPLITATEVNAAYGLSLASASFPSGLFDFTISDLTEAGDSATIVLPLTAAIPADATYQRLSLSSTAQMGNFVEDNNNLLYSAPAVAGYCPSPNDIAYTPGLTTGNWCVMLVIEDGGPNDVDGSANQTVASLVGVYVNTSIGDNGGGGLDPLFLLLLVLSGGYLYSKRKSATL